MILMSSMAPSRMGTHAIIARLIALDPWLPPTTNSVKVDKLHSTHDLVTASSITYGGTLYATNLEGTIGLSDTFQVFSTSGSISSNFSNVIGSPGAGLVWTFTPATGILGVTNAVTMANNPTNILFTLANGNLTLFWPADHKGWTLQAQTNSLSNGLGNNWSVVAGSTGVTNVTFTINPANGTVFYRLWNGQ